MGSALYSIIISYVIWLAFHLVTPWLMSFGWIALIIYWIFASGVISGLIGGLSIFIFYPLDAMVRIFKHGRYIPALVLLFFGYSSVVMPWNLNITYSIVKIIMACSLSFTAATIFFSLIASLFNSKQHG